MQVVYELDKENGKRLELVEDFSLLQEGLPKYRIIYEPLYGLNPRGVKTFSGFYQVWAVNGEEKELGIVSKDYNPVSTVEEALVTLEYLNKENEEVLLDVKPSFYSPKVEFIFMRSELKLDIIPYEYLAKRSFLHPLYETPSFEIIKRGLTLLNNYVGEVANTIAGLLQRVICRNGLTLKGISLKFRHRFLNAEEQVREKVKKTAENVKVQSFKEKEEIFMKPVREGFISALVADFKRYKVKNEIVSSVEKEFDLIKEVRNGIIPLWDFIQVLTSITTYSLFEGNSLRAKRSYLRFLKSKFERQAFNMLSEPEKYVEKISKN